MPRLSRGPAAEKIEMERIVVLTGRDDRFGTSETADARRLRRAPYDYLLKAFKVEGGHPRRPPARCTASACRPDQSGSARR